MASGPLGSRSHKKSAEELDRIIRRLNDNFALQLRKPDVTLSPRKNRERRRNDEEARVDSIYQKIRQLYYTRDDRLAAYIGHFEQRGRLILSRSISRSSSNSTSAANRALLQQCLLDILSEVYDPESRQWSKRESEELPEGSPKRAKGRLYEHHDAVDALPVRSRDSFANISTVIASENRSRGEAVQPLSQQGRSFLSARTSFHSEVFSTQTQNESFISQTSVGSESPNHSDNDPYSQTTVANFSSEASNSSQEDDVQQQPAKFSARGKEKLNGRSQYPSNSQSQTVVSSSSQSRQDSSDSVGRPLEEMFAKIWPKLPHPELTGAPLAVIWEITRAALHCNVSLDQFDLLYEPNDKWHDQRNLRDTISKHHLFHGKSLPQPSDSGAWQTALENFQTKVKTVALSAELAYNQDPTGPLYNLRLHPLKLELGHRLARRFGADRFLEITFPPPSASSDDKPKILEHDKYGLEKIVDWLIRSCHYFLGRFWRPFFVRTVKGKKASKANKGAPPERLYLFAYDGDNFRNPNTSDGIPRLQEALEIKNRRKMKLSDLLRWAISIDKKHNSEQPVTKLFSRLALSLSRTWPTVELERHQIRIRPTDLKDLREPGGKVMNDGIGRISLSLAKKVTELLGLTDCPSCFQGRLGSAKGMWLIDVDSEGDFEEDFEEDWVEIYPSQTKWECDFKDVHHRTLEIRNWPSELKSASLNQQFIPVLEARSIQPGLMRRIMSEHLQRALNADLGEQKDAMEDPMSLRLWIHQSGPSKNDRSLDGHAEFLAGLPNNSADKVAFLLDSGFDQRRLELLKDVVLEMCNKKADTLKTKMNITIPCSAYIYMAADFSSTLEEGEVHLSFSTKFQAEGFSDTLLEQMDILVARAPAHLPSDIQRVKVVSRPELRKLKDVIIFSTKGATPLADKLSGGDYDGDIAWVCWDHTIVQNFKNAEVPTPMDFIEEGYLRKKTTKFRSILDSVASGDYNKNEDHQSKHLEDACLDFISQAFLFNLQPSFLGKCTKYKERLCYMRNSVQDEPAIHLSHLLGYLVDQSKQGIEFTDEDWKRFLKNKLRMKGFYLDDPEYSKEKGERPNVRGRLHILDYLRFDVAEKIIHDVLKDLSDKINANGAIAYDEDLTKLYNMYDERANGQDEYFSCCRQLRTYLREKIDALRDEWRISMSTHKEIKGIENSTFTNKVEAIYQKWLDIKPPEELLASGHFPELLHDPYKDSATSNWELLKASTTFKRHNNSIFAWHMAGKQLAYIKAMAHRVPGETSKVMMIPEMWGILRPDKKLIMSLSRQREAARDPESVVALEEVYEIDDDGTVIDDA
ncbi:RNA dependent RNA polymerase domain-containing protein [Trichoderma evansii]